LSQKLIVSSRFLSEMTLHPFPTRAAAMRWYGMERCDPGSKGITARRKFCGTWKVWKLRLTTQIAPLAWDVQQELELGADDGRSGRVEGRKGGRVEGKVRRWKSMKGRFEGGKATAGRWATVERGTVEERETLCKTHCQSTLDPALAVLSDLVLADWTGFAVPPDFDGADEEDPVVRH
jgi:hypothetical protein